MGRILVAFDGSEASPRAVEVAVDRAWETGSTLHLLLVRRPLPVVADAAEFYLGTSDATRLADLRDAHALKSVECRLPRTGLRYSKEVIAGEPAEVISRRALELECEEIILGSATWSAVAAGVAEATPAPITLVL